jgi:hypothetical protein
LADKDFSGLLDQKSLIWKAFAVIPLQDGTYEVIVVDAASSPDDAVAHLEVTVVSGPHKGEVVRLAAQHLSGDPLALLGLPATLTVEQGVPALQLD